MSHEATVSKNDTATKESSGKKYRHISDDTYDADFVQRHIKLPENLTDVPKIVGWSGPARSGTTALLFLLAGHSQIARVYFQPQKTLMRFGGPSLELYGEDKLVCMKEVLYSHNTLQPHDPIQILLDAGVPPEKITWIVMLRDPLQTFASWKRNGAQWSPDIFAFWQRHTIDLWHKYKDSNVRIVPFVYELLDKQEEPVLKKLLLKIGLDATSLNLDFNQEMIKAKLVPGQAMDEVYFNRSLKRTIGLGRYEYTTNSYPVEFEESRKITELCQERYDEFFELAKYELGV
jgi:hypothetical protein